MNVCLHCDGIDPDDVIFTPERATELGITSTVTFPRGNLAPQGAVIKSTAIDPSVIDPNGVYRKIGPARVFTRERDAIAAVKGLSTTPVLPGDVIVLMGRGPLGMRDGGNLSDYICVKARLVGEGSCVGYRCPV